ncbi:MAG: adenosine kinase, partial [Tannerellaceae bacterium]
MNTIGLGNALVDVLLKLKSDAVLAHIGIEKGAMDMIDRQQMESIQQSQVGLERSEAPGGSACNV